jgi:hypothetical protein
VRGASFQIADGKGGMVNVPLMGYSYFQYFHPFAKVGYSIFLYHVEPEQAEEVRRLLGLPPLGPGDAVPVEPGRS